jgi:hypothetical protein
MVCISRCFYYRVCNFGSIIGIYTEVVKVLRENSTLLKGELPFSLGPFMPLSMWILKNSYGNFHKFILMNIVVDGFFAFLFTEVLKKLRIVSLTG